MIYRLALPGARVCCIAMLGGRCVSLSLAARAEQSAPAGLREGGGQDAEGHGQRAQGQQVLPVCRLIVHLPRGEERCSLFVLVLVLVLVAVLLLFGVVTPETAAPPSPILLQTRTAHTASRGDRNRSKDDSASTTTAGKANVCQPPTINKSAPCATTPEFSVPQGGEGAWRQATDHICQI